MFKKLLNPKAWALFLLMLFAIPIVANDFNSQRTDFRDESIYFMITTRFYDGDPMYCVGITNNARLIQVTLVGEATSRVLSTSSIISRHLALQPSGLLQLFRTHRVTTIMATMPWTSHALTAAIRAVTARRAAT